MQLWFGEFLHGTLELCFRYWKELVDSGGVPPAFPWPCTPRPWRQDAPEWALSDIGRFADLVESSLSQQGKQARSTAARESAYNRIELAVNELGPHLFELIDSAEKKVIGTRPVLPGATELRCSNYEVHGVIDVLTHVTLDSVDNQNMIRRRVTERCPDLRGVYEVIVDYKGMRRPRTDERYWDEGDWQVQTYAWLRGRQPEAMPVAAGILIYINELTPGDAEMSSLKRGIVNRTTDVLPEPDSEDEQLIRLWQPGNRANQLSLQFRLSRAIRVIPIGGPSTDNALTQFDTVVRLIEENIISEASDGNILRAWSPDCQSEETCVACDFRNFCPRPAGKAPNYVVSAPLAP
ncbi:MAG: PD-(D/E)XK nuclease family protein [Fimbriimonadaceae bacterium]